MYCPNCKNEYRKGIEICPECNIALVEELEKSTNMKELFRSMDEKLVSEVGRYFEHINIPYDITNIPDSSEIIFSCSEEQFKTAKMEAATVIKVYSENAAINDAADGLENDSFDECKDNTEDMDELSSASDASYVRAKDRTSDYKSSGVLFIIMGILITALAVMNITGILNWISVVLSQILMMVLGIACIIVGIASLIRSKTLGADAVNEEQLIDKIKSFLNEKYPQDTFAALMEDTDNTPEIRYIEVQNIIKHDIRDNFTDVNPELLDDIIEEYTDSMFD